jgi:hypothetical protein
MSKFKYYKRVVDGKTLDIHMHEIKDNLIIAKMYPENYGEIFNTKDLIELDNVNEFLDEGLKTKIFKTEPTPNHSS